MTLDSRIADVEQKFNTKSAEREQLLKQADECLTEMTKLQGEYRVLQELREQENTIEDKPTKASKQ